MKNTVRVRLLFVAILFFLVSVSLVCADIYDTDGIDLSADLDITIKAMKYGSDPMDVSLLRYNNPSDPMGVYWKLNGVSSALQQKTVYKETFTYLNEEPLERHQLDLYYTANSKNNKVIMFVPGGAWRQGDKKNYEPLGNTFAGFHDFTVAVVNYRLSSDEGGNAMFPDHVEDVSKAFAWIKQNIAPYGDPDKVYVFGQSAGGHLVSLLSTDKKWLNAVGYDLSDIKAVVSMSGAYYLPDLVAYPDNPLKLSSEEVLLFKAIMENAFGGWDKATLTDPSPQVHINVNQPPFQVIYTYNDLSGFALEADNFVRAVKALSPAPEITLRGIEFSDYTDTVWEEARKLAEQEEAMSEYIGHYAEIVAINTSEPYGYITQLIVDFLQSH